jgi:hypothetical protein
MVIGKVISRTRYQACVGWTPAEMFVANDMRVD